MKGPYALAPLSHTSTPQFRLLELHPSTHPSYVLCSLCSYSFDETFPAYKALSYAWGIMNDTRQIFLNRYAFPVSHNLWAFLELMHLQGQYGFYWIDAICIDQSNTLEKNHQVQMMRHIYSTHERVVIWPGEASEDKTSDMAMDIVVSIERWAAYGISGDYMYRSHFDRNKIQGHAVGQLLCRDYWTRI